MTQDFAKPSSTKPPGAPKKKGASGKAKPTKRSANKSSNNRKPSGASTLNTPSPATKSKVPLLITLILLIAAFGYGIYFLQSIPPTTVNETEVEQFKAKEIKEQTQAAEDKNQTKEKTTNRFNFYDILPHSTVTPPKVEEYKYREKTETGGYHYMVQTGSFKQLADAERQKATIALQGIKSRIKAVTNKQGTVWHRVETGPYKDRSKLNSTLDKLVSVNIQPLVKKIKIDN